MCIVYLPLKYILHIVTEGHEVIIENKIEFVDGKKTISIEPSKISLDIDFELKYENSLINLKKHMVTRENIIDIFKSYNNGQNNLEVLKKNLLIL